MSGFVGLDFAVTASRQLYAAVEHLVGYDNGRLFNGPYTNDRRQVSTDRSVRGHRHEQSVISVLRHHLDMPFRAGLKIGLLYDATSDEVLCYSFRETAEGMDGNRKRGRRN